MGTLQNLVNQLSRPLIQLSEDSSNETAHEKLEVSIACLYPAIVIVLLQKMSAW
jgi:hypothetical protein